MKIITEIALVIAGIAILTGSAISLQIHRLPKADKIEVINPTRYILPTAEKLTTNSQPFTF